MTLGQNALRCSLKDLPDFVVEMFWHAAQAALKLTTLQGGKSIENVFICF